MHTSSRRRPCQRDRKSCLVYLLLRGQHPGDEFFHNPVPLIALTPVPDGLLNSNDLIFIFLSLFGLTNSSSLFSSASPFSPASSACLSLSGILSQPVGFSMRVNKLLLCNLLRFELFLPCSPLSSRR
ncbi:hypothetical protein CONLIGDRAFT_142938 [Coniochaeta ligniaria NRRL 30616]|uniref:Uncharacterized protein n=1 Tax=Coniochaeta ligniaria NRRL 30616 TaxID=1408157 RepID=A0A1J7J6J0_9PEZI|nr:hypothetical protein CONLIGDRAFT_142938 [Coniochaeta ligniaria NRRL 30616]